MTENMYPHSESKDILKPIDKAYTAFQERFTKVSEQGGVWAEPIPAENFPLALAEGLNLFGVDLPATDDTGKDLRTSIQGLLAEGPVTPSTGTVDATAATGYFEDEEEEVTGKTPLRIDRVALTNAMDNTPMAVKLAVRCKLLLDGYILNTNDENKPVFAFDLKTINGKLFVAFDKNAIINNKQITVTT